MSTSGADTVLRLSAAKIQVPTKVAVARL